MAALAALVATEGRGEGGEACLCQVQRIWGISTHLERASSKLTIYVDNVTWGSIQRLLEIWLQRTSFFNSVSPYCPKNDSQIQYFVTVTAESKTAVL